MNISEKLQLIAENEQKVYETGYEKGKAEGGDTEMAYNEGLEAGKQAERETFWDNIWYENGTMKTVFRCTFGGDIWNVNSFKPIYPAEPIQIKNCTSMFEYCNRNVANNSEILDLTDFCAHADFSQCTSATDTFSNARVKNITVDFGNCTSLASTFLQSNSGSLNGIYIRVTEKCTKYSETFASTVGLRTIKFTDDSTIAANISFSRSSKLTDESVDSIVSALKDLIGETSKTLTVHADVYNRMVELGKDALVTAKNWTLVKA